MYRHQIMVRTDLIQVTRLQTISRDLVLGFNTELISGYINMINTGYV